jgi:hypothetical protein
VSEQGLARLVPGQVQGVYLGVGVLTPQLAQGRGEDQARGVADGDPAWLGGGPGGGRGLGG